jgi:hypothetical protein
LSSVDALVEDIIQKTHGSRNARGDSVDAGQCTPVPNQERPDETIVPSALKECCSIDLGARGVDVPYVSQFMINSREIFKDLCVLEKEVIDYCMLEGTMDKL